MESRVKDVLEEKLSVILKEIGVDKYADVLDSEAAGINYTDAYMNSIRNPKSINYNIKPIEDDLRTQVKNSLRIKDLIREDKDLSEFIGAHMSFDIDSALRSMMAYYESSIGNPILPVDSYGINDERIVKHLKKEIRQDEHSSILSVSIKDFPNEKGWFMLWHLSVSPDGSGGKSVPIFINEDGVLRPLAGRKIWDTLLDSQRIINVSELPPLSNEIFAKLAKTSQDYAFDVFSDMKDEYDRKVEENHRKYDYALSLRLDAAKRIGIENIRNHKLNSLLQEKEEMETQYKHSKQICPDFYLELLAYME